MNRLIMPVIFVLSIIVVGMVLSTTGKAPESKIDPGDIAPFAIDDKLPESAIVDENNQPVILEQILNSPSLVVFWSNSCNECVQLLKDLTIKFNASKVKVVLINIQDQSKDAKPKLEELKVPFVTYYDQQGQTFRNWSGTVPAEYYIVQNRIKYFFPGRMSVEHMDALLTLN